MEVKPGYKQTEVGVIPEDWEVKRFCEIGKLTKGKGLLKEGIKRSGAIPAIPYTALYTDFSEVLDYSLIKWFIDDETQTVIVREPCLLLASSSNMEANTGKASAIVGTAPVAIGREVIIFKTAADCKFISYLLSTAIYRRKTLTLARGTTIKHVYPATFQTYPVAHPPLPEQRAIATALSDLDGLLGGLDRLIAKKRDLKQAAMQQLLTGQTRLPGFHGEWEVKTLGDVVEKIVGGGTPSRATPAFWGNEIPWVTVKDFATFNPRHSQESITRLGLRNSASHLIPAGTLITSTRMALGKAVVYEVDVTINQDLKALFLKPEMSVAYLTYWFEHFGSLIDELGSGSTVKGISLIELRRFPFRAPPHPEQTAIASVLSEMDGELAALEQRREKTRALKQAMMQSLLTGQIRLPPQTSK
jgi:type I restriction enzyme S subunit